MILNLRQIIIVLIALITLSCQSINNNIEGYWVNINDDAIGFDYIRIIGNKVVLQDCLNNYKYGTIENFNDIHFVQNNDVEILKYQLVNDSILKFEGIDYLLFDYTRDQSEIVKFDLLGLDTDLIFSSANLKDENWLSIKLRDSKEKYPLILGEKESNLDDILLFAPRTICSGARPRNVNYDRVIIQVEKNASAKDLLNIEQQLYIEHRKRYFTIITDNLSFNSYQAIVDHKYFSGSLDSLIFKEVTDYLNVKWPPIPVFPYKKPFQDEISKINVIEIDSYFEFKNSGFENLRTDKDNLVAISTDLKIEEYLSILNIIQNIRIEKGCRVYTHFLEYI